MDTTTRVLILDEEVCIPPTDDTLKKYMRQIILLLAMSK